MLIVKKFIIQSRKIEFSRNRFCNILREMSGIQNLSIKYSIFRNKSMVGVAITSVKFEWVEQKVFIYNIFVYPVFCLANKFIIFRFVELLGESASLLHEKFQITIVNNS